MRAESVQDGLRTGFSFGGTAAARRTLAALIVRLAAIFVATDPKGMRRHVMKPWRHDVNTSTARACGLQF